MKKRIGSFSLFSIIGIGVAIGFIVVLWDIIVLIIPFEREWVTYAALAILFVMAIRIVLIWNQFDTPESPEIDIDEQSVRHEKVAHKLVGSTSLFLIIGSTFSFFAGLEWNENNNLLSGLIAFSIATITLFGFFAQNSAVDLHNKYSPGAFVNLKRIDGYEEYFKSLDEGEKFEQYRVAYKSFYAMNLLFPATLFTLFFVSIASSPQYVAILAVGILWFIMYMIYYREGSKSH